MYEHIHEPIDIYLYSKDNRTFVKAFRWQKRIYIITKNNLITRAKKGITPIYLFSVSNDNGAYKLRFDTDSLDWWLEDVLWKT